MQQLLMKNSGHQLTAMSETLLCGVMLFLFAFFSTASFPLKLAGLVLLFPVAFILSRSYNRPIMRSMLQSSAQTGVVRGLFLAIGFLFGVIGAAWYRRYSGMHVMPDSISVFACVAMCIGAMEEFVFRGYFFQRLLPVNPSLAIGFSALAHACYKLALFISPWSHPHPWTFTFFYVSLIAYLLMGVLRYYAKTIWPVVLAHIIFDLLVYAGSLDAPWWVW